MRFRNIFNFLSTLGLSVKNIMSGRPLIADFEDIEHRLAICRRCEYKVGDKLKNMKCQLCECTIRYKVRLVTSRCPEDKWITTDS